MSKLGTWNAFCSLNSTWPPHSTYLLYSINYHPSPSSILSLSFKTVKRKSQVDDNNMNTNLSKRRPYFFKSMSQTLNIGKLRIPPQFVKHISKDLSDSAILEGPFHDCWIVAVNVIRNHVYLEEGWEDFRRHHSLCNNELLLFRYDGNMRFKVQIFNPTGCERIEGAVIQPVSVPADVKRKHGRLLNDCVASKSYKDSADRNSPFDRSLGLKNVKYSKKRIEIQEGTLHPPMHEFGSVKIKEEEDSQMENQREEIDLPKKVDRLSRVGSSRERASKVQDDTEPFTLKNPHITVIFTKNCLRTNVLFSLLLRGFTWMEKPLIIACLFLMSCV